MRVLPSAYGSRGGVEPLAGLAVRLRVLGAEARVCPPPDFAERLAGVGVPLVPFGQSAQFGTALNTHQVRHAGPDAFCAQRLQANSDRS